MEAKGDFEIPKISLISQQCGHLSPGDFKKAWSGLENTTSTRIVENSSKISNHDFFWEEFSVSVLQSKQVWVPSAVIPSYTSGMYEWKCYASSPKPPAPPNRQCSTIWYINISQKKYQTIKPKLVHKVKTQVPLPNRIIKRRFGW